MNWRRRSYYICYCVFAPDFPNWEMSQKKFKASERSRIVGKGDFQVFWKRSTHWVFKWGVRTCLFTWNLLYLFLFTVKSHYCWVQPFQWSFFSLHAFLLPFAGSLLSRPSEFAFTSNVSNTAISNRHLPRFPPPSRVYRSEHNSEVVSDTWGHILSVVRMQMW